MQAFEGAELEMEDMRSVREFAETYAQAGMPLNALVRSRKLFKDMESCCITRERERESSEDSKRRDTLA